jgi:putative ABC transport system permease protein
MAAEDRVGSGENPREAEQRARREFGNPLLVREVTRDMWGWGAWERLGQDLKYALRQVRRSPGFTAVALATLALGLGATTTIFSIVNGVLLQPLAFRQPEQLYMAENIPPARAGLTRNLPVNARHFHEWRTRCQSCQDVALFQGANLTLLGAGEPVRLPALEVSYNFFRTLGVQPAIGRDFLEEEEGIGNFDKVILTDALWHSRFAGDRAIVGRRIQINGEPHLVIGILPRELHLPSGGEWGAFVGSPSQPLIFRPILLNVAREGPDGNLNFSSVIRLKPGIGPDRATAELNALLADFVRQYKLETTIGLTPLQQQVVRKDRGPLLLLLAAVGAVLLIVCVNIGNLMLVRTASRYREAGVRMALGASRLRLFRLVLMEALVLVSIGGSAGLGLAQTGLKLFVAEAPVAIQRLDEVHMDWRVLAFAAVAIAFSTIACGIVPAWRLARVEPQESLKAGAGTATEGARRLRFREVMVGLEVALSTVLLIAGGLLMASFFRLMRADKGFEVAHVITQDISFLNPKYSHGVRREVLENLTDKLARIPGVQVVGATSQLPLLGEEWVSGLRDPDRPQKFVNQDNAIANFRFVTPGYFKAMGIPLRRGRFLEESDRGGAGEGSAGRQPAAVISERAARFLWGNDNPIGKHVRGAGLAKPSLEVVGVVGEVRGKLEDAPPMMVYEHFWRIQPIAMSFALRTQADPASVAAEIRSVLSAADPEMAISPARTMEQILEASVAARRFQMYLAVAFALSALALASLGIYGVISFTVARRTAEMGIRIAVGARGAQLVGMVIRQGMIPVLAGLGAGVVSSLAVSRLIASQLYGVAPNDPVSIVGVVVLLLTVALGACWIPARRVTRVDPLTALRFE